jgi:hypothetical protein
MGLNDWLIIKQAICQSIARVPNYHYFICAIMFMIFFFNFPFCFDVNSLLVD